MRFLAIAIVLLTCAAPAGATVDPDIDQIGIYFDLDADEACLDTPLYVPFSAYLIITNPSSAVHGITIMVCREGDALEMGRTWYGTPIGMDWWSDGCYCAQWGYMVPPPFEGLNVPLVKFEYMPTGETPLRLYLRQLSDDFPEDGLPAYLGADDIERPLGVSSGDPDLPVAMVNGDCDVVSVTGKTLGGVKSLFR